MRLCPIAMILIAAACAAAIGCGGSSQHAATPEAAINVSGLTPSDIATRALAALQRDGMVTHIKEVQTGTPLPATYDLWIDWSGERARLDWDGFAARVLENGVESIFEGSADLTLERDSFQEQLLATFVDSSIEYVWQLRATGRDELTITPAELDG